METPHWLDSETWEDFRAHRKEIKKPLTPTAEKRMLRKLERLHAEGWDVNYCLDHAMAEGWRGVFAVEAPKPAQKAEPEKFKRDYVDPSDPPRPGEDWDQYHARLANRGRTFH